VSGASELAPAAVEAAGDWISCALPILARVATVRTKTLENLEINPLLINLLSAERKVIYER
jgi:hypothetical protein